MQPKEIHITTAYIALICSVLGWFTWGIIAIPGVIIAHTIRSSEPSTALARKAALRVGYTAILIGLAGATMIGIKYFNVNWQLKNAYGYENSNSFSFADASVSSTQNDVLVSNWPWIGGAFLVVGIVFVLLIPLMRKGYAYFQSARILRSNHIR